MACRSCGSEELVTLRGELTASLTTFKAVKLPPLYICENLLACPNCGFTELRIPPKQLQNFAEKATSGS
jgi:hypothetical protein